MNNKIININDIETEEGNTLNSEQLIDLNNQALKEEKFTYVFELNHNNGSVSSYEVEISTNFNSHIISYYVNFKNRLKDYKIQYHCNVTGKSYSSKEKAMESLIGRLKTAQMNYKNNNL